MLPIGQHQLKGLSLKYIFMAGCLVARSRFRAQMQLGADTQGLAPHYDDVDLWVCQTMGSKEWKIYKSPEGYGLPACSSTDFQQSELGEPVLETTLEVRTIMQCQAAKSSR